MLYVGILLFFVCIPLGYFVLGRPFDKKTAGGARVGPDYWFGPLSHFLLRPLSYAVKICVQTNAGLEATKRSTMPLYAADRLDFGDFDFRGNATRFQRAFSYLYVGSIFLLGVVFGPLVVWCEL